MNLESFPRVRLGHTSTPLEAMARLSRQVGTNIYVKRDDCTGLALGGNKARKLDFLLGDALHRGADTVLTCGAMQSNHVRQTAAAAARLGLRCIVLLEQKFAALGEAYRVSGNALLNRIFGASVQVFPEGTDLAAQLLTAAEHVRAKGGRPYVIPVGGSNPVGTLGYIECAAEIVAQARAMRLRIDHVVHASGSAGTQVGLVLGFALQGANVPVLGVSVGASLGVQEQKVRTLAASTADWFALPSDILHAGSVEVDAAHVGSGYGHPTQAMHEALVLAARTEALLLDPVYTGKAMAALITHARSGRFRRDDNIVFVHTGGAPGLFGYVAAFDYLSAEPSSSLDQTKERSA